MANMLDVSRSGYYRYCQQRKSQREQQNDELLKAIRIIFMMSRQTYGSPRVHAELKKQGFNCSRPRVARIMKKAGIFAKMHKKFKVTTRVNVKHSYANNLLQQDFNALSPNTKWVADISYIKTNEGWLYLAIVLDLFSRKIVGLAMDDSLDSAICLQALNQALTRRQIKGHLYHHSDRGCQYTSIPFQALLTSHGITCSMSGAGNCYDNAVAESFFHTLKTELVYFERYETREQAKRSIFEYVEVFYNNQRCHVWTLPWLQEVIFNF